MSTRNRYTPGVTSVVGSAVARPWDYQGQTLLDYYQQRVNENPNFQLPEGFHLRDGQVIAGRAADWGDWVGGIAKYAALGVMGYGIGGAVAPYLGGASAATAGYDTAGDAWLASGAPAATASSVAPAVAPAATTAAKSWLTSSLVAGGVDVAGRLISAKMQANALNDSAAIQAKSNAEALAYEKERDAYDRALTASHYGDYRGRIAPYVANGVNAGGRMAALLGLPAPPPLTTGSPAPPLTPNSNGTAMMRAPNGSTRQVPASEVDHWINEGAVLV